ncbi:hypothetical protein SDC9_153565 [bioreactor metagenome]|uniref:Uncharacterized protein n=1 Tax=bioreactor metagenome TaxID=1076179 RepID=A0A645EYP8_9ZZZZ
MWGIDCAPSTSTGTPCACAVAIISFTGLMVPNTLEIWAMLTIRVRSEKSFSYSSSRSSPRSFIGITLILMPLRAANSCQGTMLLWCSMVEIMTSSPSFINSSPKEKASKLIASVVPRVKMTSAEVRALINRRTVSREPSCSSVACCDKKCTPR